MDREWIGGRLRRLLWVVGLAGLTSLVALGGTFSPAANARTADDSDWPAILLASKVGSLDWPVHIANAGDGSGRIFVVEQVGRIRIIRNGVLQETPFLDIADRVSCCGERGLLSVAFPPGYAAKGHFYVDYTDRAGDTVVSRFRVTADPDVANSDSEQIVLTIDQPYVNHNGGQLAFGPNDGYLYIGMGDGGSSGDPQNRAQNPSTLLGKLLRVDVETGNPRTYTVPASNPFRGVTGYREEIWALGLRNPWRFSFDTQTGDLYIGDVGQDTVEEINHQPASSMGGENYGWRIMEGSQCFNPPSCDPSGLVLPVAEYANPPSGCASVTGGMVYRGVAYPGLQGIYLYGDYCSGHIWGLRPGDTGWESHFLTDAPFRITSYGTDESGGLWVAAYNSNPKGAIYQIVEARGVAYLPVLRNP